MKTVSFLAIYLIMLACLSNKAAKAETICMHECPSLCMKHNTEAQEIECYFFCVLNCERCPNSPTGCPPDEETKKKVAEANLNDMDKILHKVSGLGMGPSSRKLKNKKM